MSSSIVPLSTYRLQFNAAFTFDHATGIADYLAALGISHCYASSYLKAVPGSTHGYDVADPTQLNPEIGDDESYGRWVGALRRHGMGHIIDLVPNHMGIAQSANPWWQDVLENGESSRYAEVFDIDWHPLKQELEHKVLLPILGDLYGAVLDRQEIQLEYEHGAFRARYFQHVLPIAPGSYEQILSVGLPELLQELGAESEEGAEYQSILTAIRHLPGRQNASAEERAERQREKEVIKRRLAALTERDARVRAHVDRAVALYNGVKGQRQSFDALDALLSVQSYRLAYWRVAAEEINYRRFFDINELAAIRMEDPAVFDRAHAFAFELLQRGCVDGFRIDHVDGLYDPGDYLVRMRARAAEVRPDLFAGDRPLYIVVEKILGLEEQLPDWPVDGTTGYDFLVMLNGMFVDRRNERALSDTYDRFTALKMPFREIAYRGKQLVLRVSMASELNVLAHRLNRFSERSRYYRDFTMNSLNQAMREIIACFPVYRSYVNEREPEVTARDRDYIQRAVREAKRRNPNRPAAVYNFVGDLLTKKADFLSESDHGEHMNFIGKFQQVTSPVTAKGIEDTALYNYHRLVSLNEVGSEPDHFGIDSATLHDWFSQRARRFPHALSATSTHDTKRSEDVRARINVLSELPGAWRKATMRWARANRKLHVVVDGEPYPSRNEEYLLYQTLIGSWPAETMSAEEEKTYADRIVAYMEKAMREAKVYTSWINPSEEHEKAMGAFVRAVLAPANRGFRDDFRAFQHLVARYGLFNSLAQVAVKVGAPGVPDFYQGSELWDFSLVDPDNRRPVDYERRRTLLAELDEALQGEERGAIAGRLTATPTDDRLKLYATATMLRARRERRELFESGDYRPLYAEGAKSDHVFAFARRRGEQQVIVVVPRLVAALAGDGAAPVGEAVWGDTRLVLAEAEAGAYVNLFTGGQAAVSQHDGRSSLRLADVLDRFPIAYLEAAR